MFSLILSFCAMAACSILSLRWIQHGERKQEGSFVSELL